MGARKQPTPPPTNQVKPALPPAPPMPGLVRSRDAWKSSTCDTCRFMVERDGMPFESGLTLEIVTPKIQECRFGPPTYVPTDPTYPGSWGKTHGKYPVVGWNNPACSRYQRSEGK